jgi:hypothetical protein
MCFTWWFKKDLVFTKQNKSKSGNVHHNKTRMQKIIFLTLKVMVMMNFKEQLSAKQKQMLICTLATYKITKTQNENKINTYNKK